MRSLFVPLAMIALTTSAFAQDKGFVSGSLAFDSHKIENDGSLGDRTITSGTFGPAVGFNLSPVHVVGVSLTHTGRTEDYKVTVAHSTMDVSEKRSLTTIAPFYRYMKSMNEKFLLYGQLKAGFGFGKETMEGGTLDTETKLSATDIRVGPGLVYVPAECWALSADWGVLGHYNDKRTEEGLNVNEITTTSGFQASLNPGAITFALNWLF